MRAKWRAAHQRSAIYLVAGLFLGCLCAERTEATSTFCGVVKETSDGFVALRQGPGVRHQLIVRLQPLEIVLLDTGQCRDAFCSNDGSWLFVVEVPRLDAPSRTTFTQGWVRSTLVRPTTCPE